MASSLLINTKTAIKAFLLTLLPVAAVVGMMTLSKEAHKTAREADLARLLPSSTKQKEIPWVVIEADEVTEGADVPADTNVIFHVPLDIEPINREVLLGGRGTQVRYWGYCIPENYEPEVAENRQGFPGLMFLSEKERKEQAAASSSSVARRSVFDIKGVQDSLKQEQNTKRSGFRHQLNTFDPGSLCFIMSESPLPIGLDADGDQLNGKAELAAKTDPFNPDSDGDGVPDGLELRGGTQPTIRDTDSDGLIDGLEDANLNGRLDNGETDPRNRDSDRDGLCDGICTVRVGNDQIIELGEDVNLNGQVDSGETNPLVRISDPTSVNDYDAVYRCLFGDTSVCP